MPMILVQKSVDGDWVNIQDARYFREQKKGPYKGNAVACFAMATGKETYHEAILMLPWSDFEAWLAEHMP